MDDKEFDERLAQLGTAYNSLPAITGSKEIAEKVFKKEGKKKQRFLKLPAAAGFAGVFLAGGLLAFQILGGQGEMNNGTFVQQNNPPSQNEIQEKTSQAQQLFKDRLNELKTDTGNEDAELYPFVQEAQDSIQAFSSQPFANKKELDRQYAKLTALIDTRVSSIADTADRLAETKRTGENITNDELLLLLAKQDQMFEWYTEKWQNIASDAAPGSGGFEAALVSMNSGSYGDEEIRPVISEIRNAGYRFFHEGEGMINIQPDYSWTSAKLEGSLEKEAAEWLDLMLYEPFSSEGGVHDYSKLANQLLKMEQYVLNHPNFGRIDQVKSEYKELLTAYIAGGFYPLYDEPGSPEFLKSYDWIKSEHASSATFQAVKPYEDLYNQGELEKGQDPESGIVPDIPQVLKTAEPNGAFPVRLFPLTSELKGMYGEIKKSGSLSALEPEAAYKGLNVTESTAFLRVYLYALQKKDWETAYLLTDKRLSLEEFKGKSKQTDAEKLSREVYLIRENFNEDRTVAIELFLRDGTKQTFHAKQDGTPLSTKIAVK
ncbi:hypothetical protein GKZ89_19285 [Bacillus mangrovi]|uniref:Uncharacterized protein n=1 Tax=Metabacillus mangrovi TaxID=1491830 RepID=A0A7X2S9C7_9BACI|nr:hypothetical protein [Metabacillus mangrovi]MTH55541.1 hypothetical protein [Metabacillus mangrovi]